MKRIILLQIAWMVCLSAFAQQPFSKYGYKVKVATLSKGKYVEHFDQDTIVQIGTVMFNRRSGKIESFVEYDTTLSEYSLQPDLVSRWMSQDPLAEEFYDQSPYNFTDDNPINFVDPDGMAAISSFEFNVIADCPDCPNTPEYQPYINDPNMWYYDPQSGLVSNLPAVDVNGGGSQKASVQINYSPSYELTPLEVPPPSPVVLTAAKYSPLAVFFAAMFSPLNAGNQTEMDILNRMQVNARKPKNALPDKGPPNGKLVRKNDRGEVIQEKWYDDKGNVSKEKNFGHDHDGSGDPHMHDWEYPSPEAPNPVRGPARPLKPGE
jgi:hypothetical protein